MTCVCVCVGVYDYVVLKSDTPLLYHSKTHPEWTPSGRIPATVPAQLPGPAFSQSSRYLTETESVAAALPAVVISVMVRIVCVLFTFCSAVCLYVMNDDRGVLAARVVCCCWFWCADAASVSHTLCLRQSVRLWSVGLMCGPYRSVWGVEVCAFLCWCSDGLRRVVLSLSVEWMLRSVFCVLSSGLCAKSVCYLIWLNNNMHTDKQSARFYGSDSVV